MKNELSQSLHITADENGYGRLTFVIAPQLIKSVNEFAAAVARFGKAKEELTKAMACINWGNSVK